MEKIKYYLQEIRYYQWIKNLLIFAPIIFVSWLTNFTLLIKVILAFISFCLTASSVYILNDIFDLKKDKEHPRKRNRPLAAGKISLIEAKILFFIFLILGLALAYYIAWQLFVILIFYFILNFLYSIKLKHFVILDLILVAIMYLIRVYAGAAVINVTISNWLLLTTLFVSLFITAAKRRSEIMATQNNKVPTRIVLSIYNVQFFDYLLIITNVTTIIFYTLYTMTRSNLFVWSIFFVIYAMLRYLWLILIKEAGEEPERLLLEDKPILFSILAWGAFVILVLYL